MQNSSQALDMKPVNDMPIGGCFIWGAHALFGGIALMLIATTLKDVSEMPILLLFYVLAFFPNFVLWGIGRLNGRMRLQISADGVVDVSYPFTKKRFVLSDVANAAIVNVMSRAANKRMTIPTLVASGHDGKTLLSLAARFFSQEDLARAVTLLNRLKP